MRVWNMYVTAILGSTIYVETIFVVYYWISCSSFELIFNLTEWPEKKYKNHTMFINIMLMLCMCVNDVNWFAGWAVRKQCRM